MIKRKLKSPNERFGIAVRRGYVSVVRILLKKHNCDVNQETSPSVKDKPLFIALSQICSQNDRYHDISKVLMMQTHTKIKAEEGRESILEMLCATKCKSVIGVQLLLQDNRVDVNAGHYTPLYQAAKNCKEEGDYFHTVAKLLLRHKRIDVNAGGFKTLPCGTTFSHLCKLGSVTRFGFSLVLNAKNIKLYQWDPWINLVQNERLDLLEILLHHATRYVENKNSWYSKWVVRCYQHVILERLDSNYGKAFRTMLKAGVDPSIKVQDLIKRDSPLFEFHIRKWGFSRHFRTDPEGFEICRLLVEQKICL